MRYTGYLVAIAAVSPGGAPIGSGKCLRPARRDAHVLSENGCAFLCRHRHEPYALRPAVGNHRLPCAASRLCT